MIEDYFKLQIRRQVRKLKDFGVNPLLGSLALVMLFGIGVNLLMTKTEFGTLVILFISSSWLAPLASKERNLFLKSALTGFNYYKIRWSENIVVSIPMLISLLMFQKWLETLVLVLLTLLFTIKTYDRFFSKTILVPKLFSQFPFEFSTGFRKSYLVLLGSYVILFIAVKVGNPNLGIFSLLLLQIVCLSYYNTPENEIYVWVFKSDAKQFLLYKIKFALLFTSLIITPTAILLLLFFKSQGLIVAGFIGLGYVYLLVAILLKYTSYPNEVSMPKGIMAGLSLLFPPLILVLIPYFYNESIKSLNEILHD